VRVIFCLLYGSAKIRCCGFSLMAHFVLFVCLNQEYEAGHACHNGEANLVARSLGKWPDRRSRWRRMDNF